MAKGGEQMDALQARLGVLHPFWNNTRVNSTGRLVKRFSAVGPTSTRIKRMPFDEVVSYLREENVIAAKPAIVLSMLCIQYSMRIVSPLLLK